MLVFRVFSPKSPNLLVDFRNEQNADKWNQSLILHDFNRCFSPELRVYQNFSYLCPRIYVHIYTIIYTLNKKIYTSVYKYFFFRTSSIIVWESHNTALPKKTLDFQDSNPKPFWRSQAALVQLACWRRPTTRLLLGRITYPLRTSKINMDWNFIIYLATLWKLACCWKMILYNSFLGGCVRFRRGKRTPNLANFLTQLVFSPPNSDDQTSQTPGPWWFSQKNWGNPWWKNWGKNPWHAGTWGSMPWTEMAGHPCTSPPRRLALRGPWGFGSPNETHS